MLAGDSVVVISTTIDKSTFPYLVLLKSELEACDFRRLGLARNRKKTSSPLGQLLTELLTAKKLTNRAAAQIAGVSATSIQDWKNGVSPTDFIGLAKLADHLGVPLRFLLTGEHEPASDDREITLSEVLADGGELFSGICEVKIRRLVPRQDLKKK